MKEIKIPQLKFKHELKSDDDYASIVKDLIEQVKQKPDLNGMKMNPELTRALCATIEKTCNKHWFTKFNKKSLVVEILQKTYNLTEEEQSIIGNSVDFICNNKLITSSYFYRLFKFFKFFF